MNDTRVTPKVAQRGSQGPKRVQRQRTKGWRMPEGAVYVGRPSKWGNPFTATGGWVIAQPWLTARARPLQAGVRRIGDEVGYSCHAPRERATRYAVDLFRTFCQVQQRDHRIEFDAWIYPLRGHDLACWCPLVDGHGNHVPCHADVLLELANS